MPGTLFLIDGHYHLYRSFFGFRGRPLLNSEGKRVETAYMMVDLLLRLRRRLGTEGQWAIALDSPGPTFWSAIREDNRANLVRAR